ncbi:DNA-binding MurR/RpiR family transcriptional regulator [Rhizobium skierniewicense]|uniref:DNA-binding MurR/RpiR family transcriptional regulator n=1 Tax=Rhizobium skierniewicense TaxID=984260 RepID=A0A7W6G1P1_9HYPH|nr:MurR/RpiR family transcriptional regulator [Rhizobium skierniewicense]MBB3946218.1 DNA-binding MurR/RpiR family transcriptional regulator [Rhizobium skierniewicense]NTF32974.1 MurR/RpiR family transcriptional regulator [Rhizobium skierniewicense]
MEKLLIDLTRSLKTGTPSERRIAKYLIEHLAELPFETAATLAEKLNLSPMTVGRFLRSLGYRQLSDIREHLREEPRVAEPAPAAKQDVAQTPLSSLMLQQIQAVQAVYDLAGQSVWKTALGAIAESRQVFIASSAESFGICRYFYTKLLECREHVHYLQRDGATYIALMDEPTDGTLLILMDCGGDLAGLQRLAKMATRAGYKTVLITTRFYEWGPDSADICLTIPLSQNGGHSMLQLVAITEFMLHSMPQRTETGRKDRYRRIGDMQRVLHG